MRLAKPSIDGLGVRSETLNPKSSLSPVPASEDVATATAPEGSISRDVSTTSGLESLLSRWAPLPSKATFLREPLRRRVFCCCCTTEDMADVGVATTGGEEDD